jgi:uncharacterized protein
MNLLSQEADIITTEQYNQILSHTYPDNAELIRKGYLAKRQDEEQLFNKKYLKFLDEREADEVQLFFVPSYACNFNCPYCYQDAYQSAVTHLNDDIIKAFFSFMDSHFNNRKKYITFFGGEPLLNTKEYKRFYTKFISESNLRNLDIAFVTNGYHLPNYIDILKEASIREIQITIDGLQQVHDSRRPLKNGKGTFNKIVEGIDLSIHNGFPVNLRMVLDKQNIEELPKLARFAIEKKWIDSTLFKTQLGRNYELHHCQLNADQLYNRIDLYRDIYLLIKKYPEILEFHKPAFSVSRFLFEEGRLPAPLFDSCPGTKTEWAFDATGKIYSCTATVGKAGEELGSYYPRICLDDNRITDWESRDILAIPECRECNLQLACGGGCGSVAKNKSGRLLTPDCRPVKELLELGISLYFKGT